MSRVVAVFSRKSSVPEWGLLTMLSENEGTVSEKTHKRAAKYADFWQRNDASLVFLIKEVDGSKCHGIKEGHWPKPAKL